MGSPSAPSAACCAWTRRAPAPARPNPTNTNDLRENIRDPDPFPQPGLLYSSRANRAKGYTLISGIRSPKANVHLTFAKAQQST